jgi:hypothetical protein
MYEPGYIQLGQLLVPIIITYYNILLALSAIFHVSEHWIDVLV